ncbi:hypothetical protein [Actinocatenispora sera]|uniref:Protein RecA n=1 Tax=Actinocatenispora sera TaxID=390989 RepID=A0A810LCH8_9ACTN|nr:hypothetical protein [Actinocatenispora sera]BCJ31931.1 hypothetical protein Asera_60390 [Actinocatenispora sera]
MADVAELRKLIDDRQIERGIMGGLPVPGPLRSLLPGGLSRQRATVITCGIGSLSLAMSLAAAGTDHGGWVAVVGIPHWGVVAAQELGVAAERTVLVPEPGPRWAAVVSALADGMRMVVTRPTAPLTQRIRMRLQTRIRQANCVLMVLEDQWSEAAVRLSTTRPRWHGIYPNGRGRLARRELTVHAAPRSGRPAIKTVWLPNGRGQIAEIAPTQLVQSWWSGRWGRWNQIRLKLEDAGPDGWVTDQQGPDGIDRRTYHRHDTQALRQVQEIIDEFDYLPWRDSTSLSQRPAHRAPSAAATARARP